MGQFSAVHSLWLLQHPTTLLVLPPLYISLDDGLCVFNTVFLIGSLGWLSAQSFRCQVQSQILKLASWSLPTLPFWLPFCWIPFDWLCDLRRTHLKPSATNFTGWGKWLLCGVYKGRRRYYKGGNTGEASLTKTVSFFLPIAVIKAMTKSNMWRKGFISAYSVSWKKSLPRNLGAGTKAKIREKGYLLAY